MGMAKKETRHGRIAGVEYHISFCLDIPLVSNYLRRSLSSQKIMAKMLQSRESAAMTVLGMPTHALLVIIPSLQQSCPH